jgi:Ca-activated chloride channel family protein
MKTTAVLSHSKVRHDQENNVHLVVSLEAPKLDWEKKRAPVCIIPVIDVSGSMRGDKLAYAQQSAMKLVEHLKPGDYCGLVAFSDGTYPLVKPKEMTQTQKDHLKTEIGKLRTMGCTDFSGGMLQGLKWASEMDLPDAVQVRVIMFTDGHANMGHATDLEGLSLLLQGAKGRASLSAFGYGEGADQDLLAELAKRGGGNYAFVRNPEDALTAFARELGGLLSTYATGIEVEVKPHNGHQITEVISDVDVEELKKGVKISLPNIYSEERRDLVFALTLSEQTKPLPRKLIAAKVSLSYNVIGADGAIEKHSEEVSAKVRFVKPGEEQTEADEDLLKIVSLAQLVQAQVAAEARAGAGDYSGAEAVLCAAAQHFQEQGQVDYANMGVRLGGMYSNQREYTTSSSLRNSSRQLASRSAGTSMADRAVMKDFENLGVSLGNSAQESLVEDFTGGAEVSDSLILGGQSSAGSQVQVQSKVQVTFPPMHTTSGKVRVPKAKSDPTLKKNLSKNRSRRW